MDKNIDLCFVGSKPESTFIGLTNEQRIELANDLQDIRDKIQNEFKGLNYPYQTRCELNLTLKDNFYIIEMLVDLYSKDKYMITFLDFNKVNEAEYMKSINTHKKLKKDLKYHLN